MSDSDVVAAIRERAEGEPPCFGGSESDSQCRHDRRWLLARVGQLEARITELETLDASKDRVIQRLISEHNEELRVVKGGPERKRRVRPPLLPRAGQRINEEHP
jgi:Mg2+ and Co2+ transporter CorA